MARVDQFKPSWGFFAHVILLTLVLLIAVQVHAQARFPMRYLDDVARLGTELDDRKSVDLGLARVFPDDKDFWVEWVEGKDRAGKLWRFGFTRPGIVGTVGIWTADFDHNGQPDLLIAPFMPQNGRCAFATEIILLLFDKSRRPQVWSIGTQMPDWDDESIPHHPALILDLMGDRRASFVSATCEYAERPGLSTDWRITGVYEARDLKLVPMRKAEISSYERATKDAYPHGDDQQWLPITPDEWREPRSVPIENDSKNNRK